jgi:hypothetical protein
MEVKPMAQPHPFKPKEPLMAKVLISLVGHQPLPLLLVIKHLQPDKVILIGSKRTKEIRSRLKALVQEQSATSNHQVEILDSPNVDPWNFLSIPEWFENVILPDELELGDELLCDVTGGTKAMSIGLMRIAMKYKAKILYLDSEGADNRLWQYSVQRNALQDDIALVQDGNAKVLAPLLTIQDLFDVYLGKGINIKPGPIKSEVGARFEAAVLDGFKAYIDEARTSVCIDGQPDIDIILRRRNKFAVVECKSGNLEMKAIQQLNNIASERYLGTYTAKILALAKDDKPEIQKTARDYHGFHLLKVTDWRDGQPWSEVSQAEFQKIAETAFNSLVEE